MKTAEPRAIELKDYRPPAYRIADIALDVHLDPEATRVTARMKVVRAVAEPAPLVLDGKNLKLLSVQVDGKPVDASAHAHDATQLTLHAPPAEFTLELVTEIAPAKNTALEGLYMSNGIYCTQCEPEGFRAITYFLDRPDNLARYETRIEGDKASYPVLLSNGNLIESGDLAGGRHFARWQDPFPKPSYLFALVAGDLGAIHDTYVTGSGRTVRLSIFVEHGNEAKATYAMDSLKRAMRWDEEAYGREYDLDIFMIVAVSAFNFGAMENKGLNIFNDKVLLASPQSATDEDYARIESVVGHEYFHNWTGDRITCRDWFQLSLKEGLTVFRESGFVGDMRSHAVRRISDVKDLRLRQFQEDAGPLAHPVQPQSYIAIDNFYTATVYEKGAEVIGMLKTIVGAGNFRKGMDLYFDRHDGQAATVEDFVRCFEESSGRDLQQFRLWYRQAGTPEIEVRSTYDSAARSYRLALTQRVPPTPGQPDKQPMHIPFSLGLIGRKTGRELPVTLEGENAIGPEERVIELTEASQEFVFTGVTEEPLLSLGRNFSAPVRIRTANDRKARAFLMSRDADAFNRWEAGQQLATDVAMSAAAELQRGQPARVDKLYLDAIGGVLARADEDPAFTAQMLLPPSENELALAATPIDPVAIYMARRELIRRIGQEHGEAVQNIYSKLRDEGPFDPSAKPAGRRALRNAALRILTAADDDRAAELAHVHYIHATNMTDMVAGLSSLARIGGARADEAFAHFHDRFQNDPLVLDKWMGLQAMAPQPDAVERVRALMRHPAFSFKVPNRVRALVGSFATGNPLRFHDKSGAGYRLLREVVQTLDVINPQTAARMMTPFETWRRYDPQRQALIRAELETIAAQKPLSPNLYEIVMKILGTNPG
jgi:aminopeptidase N